MHVEKHGAGPAVVLIHGLGAHSFSWRDTAAALSGRFTTYAVDLLGFGKSAAPPGFACTAKAQADAVADFMRTQGLTNPIIVGHSMGGAVCLYLAAQAGTGKVPTLSKMVLAAPVTKPPSLPFAAGSVGAPSAVMELPGRLVAKMVLEQAYADASRITPAQIDGYAKGLSSPAQKQALTAHAANLAKISFSPAELGKIKTETLVVWGEDDTFLPIENGEALQKGLPNASLERIADCGHIPHEEHAGKTNRLIAAFL